MKHHGAYRIVLDILLGISIIFGWWFVAIPIAFLGAWLMPYFAEVIFFALIHDLLYGIGSGMGFFFSFLYTISALILLLIIQCLKVAVRQGG